MWSVRNTLMQCSAKCAIVLHTTSSHVPNRSISCTYSVHCFPQAAVSKLITVDVSEQWSTCALHTDAEGCSQAALRSAQAAAAQPSTTLTLPTPLSERTRAHLRSSFGGVSLR